MQGSTDKFRKGLSLAAQSFADACPVPVFVTLPDTEHVYLNPEMLHALGRSNDESISHQHRIFTPRAKIELQGISDGPTGATSVTLSLLRHDGTEFEANFKVVLLRDEANQLVLYGTSLLPLQGAKPNSDRFEDTGAIDDQNRDSNLERQVFRFAERSNVGLLVVDENGSVRYANATLERILAKKKEQILGKTLPQLIRAYSADTFHRRVIAKLRNREGGTQTIEAQVEGMGRRELNLRWHQISENSRVTGLVVTDVTTTMIRQRCRHALAQLSTAAEVDEILRGLREGVQADTVALLTVWSERASEVTIERIFESRSDDESQAIATKVAKPILAAAKEYLLRHGSLRLTHKMTSEASSDGRTLMLRPIEDSSGRVEGFIALTLRPAPDGWVVYEEEMANFARRIALRYESDRRALEVVERRKRESLEQLARGIAHDFNNVLMSIYGHLQLIERKVQKLDDEKFARNVEHALRSSERGKQLVSAMIAFSENTMPSLVSTNVSELAHKEVDTFKGLVRSQIAIEVTIEEQCFLMADPLTLAHAIQSLLLNARDAVEAARRSREDEYEPLIKLKVCHESNQKRQREVVISVTDNGQGMSEAVKERIFDPFYTTREPGSGTGLGMTVVQATMARL
ncbi:MAG: PAS domain-containing protein, partial [Planctomycetes bacterium]|nr:PAS domain-containing protein [Planctomycetota bacterium]